MNHPLRRSLILVVMHLWELLLVFSKLFSKKNPYTEIKASAETIQFLGEPSGDGLTTLKDELAKILREEGNTNKAYLTKIKYPGEDRIRVALVIDGKEQADKMAQVIALACQSVASIDIIFFESLTQELKDKIQQLNASFYVAAGA